MALTNLRVDRALLAATEAGRRAGLDVEGATVVRVRSSINVELSSAGVMARVETADRIARAALQVTVAGVWAARGAAVPALVHPQLQPFVFDDCAVTLWAIRCAEMSTRIAEEAQLRVAGILGRSRAVWKNL